MENHRSTLYEFFQEYQSEKESHLFGRYVNYDSILPLLKKWSPKYKIVEVGKSVRGIPINAIYIGKGKNKILVWSQMHGNESTTTKAVFDFIKTCAEKEGDPVVQSILSNCSICILPMLNPDGAKEFIRVNANGIDLNRDAFDRREPESQVLRKVFLDFHPDYCFNMHDQRTIFSAGKENEPATLSFLTPSMDKERSVTDSRKISMQLIVAMLKELKKFIPGKIGRYDDTFNINCAGDTFQSEDIPTVLFEAGHFPGDYQREQTRNFVFIALVAGLFSISENLIKELDWNRYFSIPENEKLFYDVVLRNCSVREEIKDVAIQFKEKLEDGKIIFIPVIEKIADRVSSFGHKEIDCRNLEVKDENKQELNENDIVEKFRLNNEIITIIKE